MQEYVKQCWIIDLKGVNDCSHHLFRIIFNLISPEMS